MMIMNLGTELDWKARQHNDRSRSDKSKVSGESVNDYDYDY